ncbi:MAG: OmpA family protein [Candidatus Omnitrophica bacterium]|nr:OmpA family protein [Candidatus Omnitrophota bacterium]
MEMRNRQWAFILLIAFVVFLSGCSTLQKARQSDALEQEIQRLQSENNALEREKNQAVEKAQGLEDEARKLREENSELDRKRQSEVQEIKDKSLSDLEKAKAELEKSLAKELGEYKAKLEMTERGLVITLLAEIFFDSGKDVIKVEGESILKRLATVLNTSAVKSNIAVEGHTDNEPIKYSGWKSNWELSSARALSVVHYFIDKFSVKPERFSGAGCGEYRPVADNATPKGKQKNRRVEIVILPSSVKKIKAASE